MTTPYIMYSKNDNLFTLSANWPENLTQTHFSPCF